MVLELLIASGLALGLGALWSRRGAEPELDAEARELGLRPGEPGVSARRSDTRWQASGVQGGWAVSTALLPGGELELRMTPPLPLGRRVSWVGRPEALEGWARPAAALASLEPDAEGPIGEPVPLGALEDRVQLHLEPRLLVLRFGAELCSGLRDPMGLASRLSRRLLEEATEDWSALAEARGLSFDPTIPALTGELEGMAVDVRVGALESPAAGEGTTISVAVPGGLPRGMMVASNQASRRLEDRLLNALPSDLSPALGGPIAPNYRPSALDEARVSLSDPVAGMLVEAWAEDPAAADALLSREGVTEVLLPVVHGLPGSTVERDGVWLREPGVLREELGERLDMVLALAKALSSP